MWCNISNNIDFNNKSSFSLKNTYVNEQIKFIISQNINFKTISVIFF